ncbi:hypothetical protein V6U89_07025 [Micromonospora sp. CPCC 206171]|uniref:hypothetical protein n=1 Tax=Micromonospora sp. CPCC 206171 TaxID=3122405 RepID=UPI002FF21E1C
MGTDIAGCVEIRPHGPDTPWILARIDLDRLPRHYDAFGLLFGIRNYAGFEPVAAARGIPEDASEAARALPCLDTGHGHTWVTWAELARIDWERPASKTDDRLHEYRITSQGLVKLGKANVGTGLAWRAVAGEHADPRGSSHPEGTEWRRGDRLWRVERLVQGDVLRTDPELRAVLDAMHELAEQHGDDNVRLVVWFDS